MIKINDRVRVSPTFPDIKAAILLLTPGDTGTVVFVYGSIAAVKWDKGHNTNANVCDLDVI